MTTVRSTARAQVATNEHLRAGFYFLGMALAIELVGGTALLLAYFFR